MCGKLPAIVSATGQVEGIDQAILGEGEKLCPYCLMKRIFSFKPGPVLSEILEYRGGVDLGSYPSLADMATFDLKDSFIKALPLLNELWKDPSTKELIKKLMGRILGEENREVRVLSWKYQRRKFKEISESNADLDLKEILLRLLCAESEDVIVEKEKRAHWNELRSVLSKRGMTTSPINTYYSLIRADGDDMGKILSGNIRDIGINVENYISSLFEGKSKEIISKILKNDITSAKEERLDEENVDEVKKAIDRIKSERRIPVSISYHVSISRALMVAALNDVKFVEENNGVVIYAGGDDLLAVAPVSSAIKIIHGSRLTYSGLEKDHGRKAERFYKFNKYYIPSMGNAGRSCSLYIAHYRYPLYEIIRDSALKLEEVAKESTWVDGGNRRKDSLVVTYSPRGSPVSSVLPFSIEKSDGGTSGGLVFTNLTSFLENIIDGISSGKISTALLYEASGGDLMKTATRMWETMKKRGWTDPDLFEALVKYLVGRHLLVEKEEKTSFLDSIVRPILENRSLVRKSLDGETPLFIEIFRTCRLFYSGLRGD
jgi:CRISPR-associated protein Cmr2